MRVSKLCLTRDGISELYPNSAPLGAVTDCNDGVQESDGGAKSMITQQVPRTFDCSCAVLKDE